MQKNEDKNAKRLTFQGLINAEKEKVPEKSSRSRSRNRSKASSISKSMSNMSQLTSRHSQKVEPRKSPQKESVIEQGQKTTVSQSVFRENRRTAEQQMMRKIIKLKNTVTRLETVMKENLSNKSKTQLKTQSEVLLSKFNDIQNFLQQFDAQTLKQTKQIGDSYLKQLQTKDRQLQNIDHQINNYKFITLPKSSCEMQQLENKLKQLQLNLL